MSIYLIPGEADKGLFTMHPHVPRFTMYLLLPQGFGPEAKTRGGIIVSPAYTYKECVNIGVVCL